MTTRIKDATRKRTRSTARTHGPVDVASEDNTQTPTSQDDLPLLRYTCPLCQKVSDTSDAQASHLKDAHDGKHQSRIFPLKCFACDGKGIMTRSGLLRHFRDSRCPKIDEIKFPLTCPCCSYICNDLASLGKHASICDQWEQDTRMDTQLRARFREVLLKKVQGQEPVGRLLVSYSSIAEVRYPTGESGLTLLVSDGPDNLEHGASVFLRKIPGSLFQESMSESVAPTALTFGHLANLEAEYQQMSHKHPVWLIDFESNGQQLASMFLECVVQWGQLCLMALKVEVYGVQETDDVHWGGVRPNLGFSDSFKIHLMYHDSATKLVIQTADYTILVTMSVDLSSGTVYVGPDYGGLVTNGLPSLYLKNEALQHPQAAFVKLQPRQLRSKFDKADTFALFGAVVPRLRAYDHQPATFRTLFLFKKTQDRSGVKIAAALFHQLYNNMCINKVAIQRELDSTKGKRTALMTLTQGVLDAMQGPTEPAPVSPAVNAALTKLAHELAGSLKEVNQGAVKPNVTKVIIHQG